MSITVHIIKRPVVTAAINSDKWWKSLTKEQQKEYIEQHPNSKFARNAKKPEPPPHHKIRKGGKKDLPKNLHSVKEIFMEKLEEIHEEDKAFFEHGGDAPNSEERRGVAKHIRTNRHEIIHNIKGQFKEWKDGCGAITKLATGKKISTHEKKALKGLLIDAAVIAGAITVTGGFAHGAALAMKHVGFDVLKDVVLKAVIRGTTKAMGASMGHTGALVGLHALATDKLAREKFGRELEQAGWFDFLSKEKKEEYLDKHPASQLVKQARTEYNRNAELVVKPMAPGSHWYGVFGISGSCYLRDVTKQKAQKYADEQNEIKKGAGARTHQQQQHNIRHAYAASSKDKIDINDKVLQLIVDQLAEYMEKGDIPKNTWEKVLGDLSKKVKKKKK
jgi:hypothetical protein